MHSVVQLAWFAASPTTNKPIRLYPRAIQPVHFIHTPIIVSPYAASRLTAAVHRYQVPVHDIWRCKLAIVIAARANHPVRRKTMASGATDHALALPTRDSQGLWVSRTNGKQVRDVTVFCKFSVWQLVWTLYRKSNWLVRCLCGCLVLIYDDASS